MRSVPFADVEGLTYVSIFVTDMKGVFFMLWTLEAPISECSG
jgi:hypothetical protein